VAAYKDSWRWDCGVVLGWFWGGVGVSLGVDVVSWIF